jgi:RNA polymerase sigma-70 factor (ECF subfamily)
VKEIFVKRRNPEPDRAFAQLMREHERAVFALAYGKLRNAHDAEDIAQEVFVEAFRNAHKLKNAEKVSAWLFKVTSNRCKDHFRKMSRRQRRERIYASSAKSMDELNFDESTDNGVLKAVSSLPEKYRTTVMLRHFARLSYAEIAKATGLSETTIDARLRTAKKKLRKTLSEKHEGVD